MWKSFAAALAVCAVGLAAPTASLAQPATIPPTSKDPATVPAGVYTIDLNHSSVIARVGHDHGISFSTMRFAVTKATLNWDPANPAAIKLEATVDTKPRYEPVVYRTAPEGPIFLNAAKFPEATFVSTAVTKTGPASADVAGNLSLLGVSRPVVMHIEMVGASKNGKGVPVVGFTGSMQLKRADFGNTSVPSVSNEVMLQIDGEFQKG